MTDLEQVLKSISDLKDEFKSDFQALKADVDASNTKTDNFNEKFDNYQKATQSLVNLAFGLIASATIITIASSIFRR